MCLIGILLSVPFLPPIDGGKKYHSGSAPFFFVLVAMGLYSILSHFKLVRSAQPSEKYDHFNLVCYLSVLLIAMALIGPLIIKASHRKPKHQSRVCSAGEVPYAFQMYAGTYIDILPQTSTACGRLPELCLADFDRLGTDKVNDDFFRKLVDLAGASRQGIRVTTANDLISSDYYFFISPHELLSPLPSHTLIAGCAKEVKTQFQQALLIQSVDS